MKNMQISGTVTMRRRTAKLATAIAMLAVAACSRGADDAAGAEQLPRLPIDPASVTVSGISSGGAMATQFHVAHSSLVRGAGLLAASPYRCAEGSVREALGRCMKGEPEIPVAQLVEQTRQLARDGRIDAAAGLEGDRVWLFRGSADPYVQAITKAIALARALNPDRSEMAFYPLDIKNIRNRFATKKRPFPNNGRYRLQL